MFSKDTFRKIAAPALFLLLASIACSFLFKYDLGIVPIIIQETIAFLFGYFAVVRPGRSRLFLWIIYIVLFLLLNIGGIAG